MKGPVTLTRLKTWLRRKALAQQALLVSLGLYCVSMLLGGGTTTTGRLLGYVAVGLFGGAAAVVMLARFMATDYVRDAKIRAAHRREARLKARGFL